MKGVMKPNLPKEVCAACGRPIAWRKKWAPCWDEAKGCSDRYRRLKRGSILREGDSHDPEAVSPAGGFKSKTATRWRSEPRLGG